MSSITNNQSIFRFTFISIYNLLGLAFITFFYQINGLSPIFYFGLGLFSVGFLLFTWLWLRKPTSRMIRAADAVIPVKIE